MSKNSRPDPLIVSARKAARLAYAPYSGYRVGAAFELAPGVGKRLPDYVTGCNVENASYGLTVCAERAAVFRLVGGGTAPDRVRRLCVSARGSDYPYPCGACRQVLYEFFSDLEIVLDRGTGQTRKTRLKQLLPAGFRLKRDKVKRK